MSQPLTIQLIKSRVAEHYAITPENIVERDRRAAFAWPRQVAMFLCRRLVPGASLHRIGDAFGGRDHGTVMHACRRTQDEMDLSTERGLAVLALERSLLSAEPIPALRPMFCDKCGHRLEGES